MRRGLDTRARAALLAAAGAALALLPAAAASARAEAASRAGGASLAGASPTAQNGPIAFHRGSGGSFDIYAVNPDGTGEVRLTTDPAQALDPDWSPDGSRIAFQSNRDGDHEIYVMNADGSAQTQLTANGAGDDNPSWSPDGSKIAFTTGRDGNNEIYVVNSDGDGEVRLTTNGADDRSPAWSPDGSKIAFQSDRAGSHDVYVMNSDGTGQTRLTTDPASDGRPAWAPDGSSLAFDSSRDGNSELYVMSVDGTGQMRLTTNGSEDKGPAWAPGGSEIAFTSNRDGNAEIYVMNADGTDQTRLTTNGLDDDAAAWAAIPGSSVVTNTNDRGPGSLRAAIEFSNANAGPDTITFAIRTTDAGFNGRWFTITPHSELPPLTDDATTIDGSTQTRFTGDTNSFGPEVELDGSSAPPTGLRVSSSDGRVEGLAMNRFGGAVILMNGSRNVVAQNYLGTDPTGAVIVGNGHGVLVGEASPAQLGRSNRILGNLIAGNEGPGISVAGADQNVIQGNRIERNQVGIKLGGGLNGTPPDDNLIGGTGTGQGNVVSGNTAAGIELEGARNVVQGNRVGTDAAGAAAFPNTGNGINITAEATASVVGGPSAAARNVVSGNGGSGINVLGAGTRVEGNYVGTNARGTAAIPNGNGGVRFASVTGSTISENVISGNAGFAIGVLGGTSGSGANAIVGNLIGTDASGMAAVPNGGGISFFAGALAGAVTDNIIGGSTAAERNVISGNSGSAISFAGSANVTGNTIRGNYIGTAADGSSPLGNGLGNVGSFAIGFFAPPADGPSGNRVEANVIAYNEGGVIVGAGTRNAISRNSIFSNTGLGVDLGGGGVTANDAGDADGGPNDLQNHPVLKKSDLKGDLLVVKGEIDTPNPETVVIEIFANAVPAPGGDPSGHGEGTLFLGTATPKPNGTFSVELPPLPAGTLVTATATDAAGNTSEFAANVEVK